MKLTWPTPFVSGDLESWLDEFTAIAACNGIGGDTNLLTALGTLLDGRAKAVYLLTRRANPCCSFAEMRAALCAEFGKEDDRQRALDQFHSARWDEQEDLVVFFHRLDRQLAMGLPELQDAARERLLRQQFVRSLPEPLHEEVKLVSMVGDRKALDLVRVAQNLSERVTMRRVQQAELDQKVDQLAVMVEQLLSGKTPRTISQRNASDDRNVRRCFRCNRVGHVARYCTKDDLYHCFSLSWPSRWRVPVLKVTIEGVPVQAIVDTGAGVSITKKFNGVPVAQSSVTMQTVGGHRLIVTGTQRLRIMIGGTLISHTMFIVEETTETIIGNDILRRLGATIDLRNDVLIISNEKIELNNDRAKCVGHAKVLPDCQNRRIRDALSRYAHLFTDADDEYGYCNWVEHRIRLVPGGQCKPIFRRIPQNTLAEVQKQVADMEAKGIIRRTNSPYSSPVLLTKKADGTYRFCIDFRELNRVTVKDAFPMPQMEEIFSNLHGAKLISLIDLRSGYWQLPIAEEDRHKTAFSVNGQQYEFLRMPFGLCNAPATFRRLLLMVLENLRGVVVYGDDIIVFSETEEEHATRLEAVLQRLEEAGLKLSRKKSQIAQKSIVCLGHVVGNGQVHPLPEKRETIKRFAVPTSKRQLRSFLGVVAYDSKFVPQFAEKISPLLKLLHKNEPFAWTAEADQAFNQLKACISDAPTCLRLPNPDEQFTVAVDASNVAIGAVLSQPAGVVEYASRVLTPAEQKYSTTEKECLAIVWALEKWRNYLLASEFRVVTDHKPLSWLMTAKDPRGRLARWAYRLQEFNFTIEHVDGTRNTLPDLLSRPSLDDLMPDNAIPVRAVTLEDRRLLRNKKTDEFVGVLCSHLRAGTKPEVTSDEMKELLKIWDMLSVENDDVVVEIEGRKVLFVPPNQRERVMRITHDGAHMGFERVFDVLRKRVFWPTMRKDVATYIRGCPNCQTGREMETPRPPMQSIEVREPFQCWGLDVFGPLPISRSGNRYILVMIDQFTRWVEAVPIKDQTGETVAQAFEFNVPTRYGIPQCVITDQGPCFESRTFKAVLDKWGIQRRRTSPYHPQANGMTERFNRTMKMWVNCTKLAWEEAIPEVLFAYRTSTQSTTKVSPFELQFGREPRILLDTCLTKRDELEHPALDHERLRETAERETEVRQARNKRNYDARYRSHKWRPFKVGDQVKVRNCNRPDHEGPGSSKFRERWKGPYTILDHRGPNFRIGNEGMDRWVNATLLRPWYERGKRLREGAGVAGDKSASMRKQGERRKLDGRGFLSSIQNPSHRGRSGSQSMAGNEAGARIADGIFVESVTNPGNTSLAEPARPSPSRVTQPRTSKAQALERLMADRDRMRRRETTKGNRETALPNSSSR